MSLLVKGKLPKVLLMMMPICCFLFSVLAQESPSETTVSNEIGTLTGTNSLSASNSTSYSDYPYSVRTIRSAPKEYLEKQASHRSSIIWGGICLIITISALFCWFYRHKIWLIFKAIGNKQS